MAKFDVMRYLQQRKADEEDNNIIYANKLQGIEETEMMAEMDYNESVENIMHMLGGAY